MHAQTTSPDALAQDPTWAVLLHHDGRQFTVDDPTFLLSAPHPSLQAELQATLQVFATEGQAAVCRFPARYRWLRRHLTLPDWSLDACPEWHEFMLRAPADRLSLVFASESLRAPASMMGHLFLLLEGQDAQGRTQAHSVSFYTDADTLNLPKLLFDATVRGKPGHYALRPYADDVRHYVTDEGRNLWVYTLQLDDDQRQLVRDHVLELRHSRFTYFFQRHNCATLIRFIVALARPELAPPPSGWDSPRSVLQRAQAAGLLADTRTLTPPAWQLRALGEDLSSFQRQALAQVLAQRSDDDCARAVQPQLPDGEAGWLALSWAATWSAWQESQAIDTDRPHWRACSRSLQARLQASTGGATLESGDQLNPLHAPPEIQVAAGLERQSGQWAMRLGLLPLAHRLEDDHRHALQESAQELLSLWVRRPVGPGHWQVDQLTLYRMTSLLPHDALLGGWSTHAHIGWLPAPDATLQERHTWQVEAGAGQTWRVHCDMDLFALAMAGTQWRDGLHGIVRPELGLIVREVGNMKTTLRATRTWHQLGEPGWGPVQWQATQSLFVSPHWQVTLEAALAHQDGHTARRTALNLHGLF